MGEPLDRTRASHDRPRNILDPPRASHDRTRASLDRTQASHGSTLQNEWKTSMCHYADTRSCCLGVFCPCILTGETKILSRHPQARIVNPTSSSCFLHGIGVFLCCSGWICACNHRIEIRESYGIPGDYLNDCCTAYYCRCCTSIQLNNEVKTRQELKDAAASALQKQQIGYQRNPSMVVPTPMSEKIEDQAEATGSGSQTRGMFMPPPIMIMPPFVTH